VAAVRRVPSSPHGLSSSSRDDCRHERLTFLRRHVLNCSVRCPNRAAVRGSSVRRTRCAEGTIRRSASAGHWSRNINRCAEVCVGGQSRRTSGDERCGVDCDCCSDIGRRWPRLGMSSVAARQHTERPIPSLRAPSGVHEVFASLLSQFDVDFRPTHRDNRS